VICWAPVRPNLTWSTNGKLRQIAVTDASAAATAALGVNFHRRTGGVLAASFREPAGVPGFDLDAALGAGSLLPVRLLLRATTSLR
jgi:hypothetical protein